MNKKIIILILCTLLFSFVKSHPIDVVIPCHEKDTDKLEQVISSIKKYAKDIQRIIVVSNKKLTDNAEWFDEAKFQFNKEKIAFEIFKNKTQAHEYVQMKDSRVGWFFQQFIKLYAAFIIPNITERILVYDADTILLKPISFIDNNNIVLFNISTIENHRPYFEHAEKLIPNFERKYPQYSGITHHMVLDKKILSSLFDLIRKTHNDEPWKVMCHLLDKKHIHPLGSAMSEYEIYFNYALINYPNEVKIRPLKWTNMRYNTFKKNEGQWNLDYASCHTWL